MAEGVGLESDAEPSVGHDDDRLFGGSGIRTHGPLRVSGFQDRCNRPLCHPSGSSNANNATAVRIGKWSWIVLEIHRLRSAGWSSPKLTRTDATNSDAGKRQ